MRRYLIFALLALAFIMFLPSVQADNSQLFFDDFSSSGKFLSQWTSPTPNFSVGNYSVAGGLNVWETGTSISTTPANAHMLEVQLIANQSSYGSPLAPTVGVFYPNQTTFMSFSLQPFNMSNAPPRNVNRLGEVDVGFKDQMPDNASDANFIGFRITETDYLLHTIISNPQLAMVNLAILFPFGGGGTCFDKTIITDFPTPLQCGNPSIRYGSAGSLDLNTAHTFNMEIKTLSGTNIGTDLSWVAFQVDKNAWLNVTNVSCGCLNHNLFGGAKLYPAIQFHAHFGCVNCGASATPQGIGSFFGYMLVDNYVPTTLPAGIIITSTIVPPATLPQPFTNGGGTLTSFMQFEAFHLGGGNVYAGGMFLTGLVTFIMAAVIALVVRRTGGGLGRFSFMLTFTGLGIGWLFYLTGVIPLLIPVSVSICAVALAFGIIRNGPSIGGVVPD